MQKDFSQHQQINWRSRIVKTGKILASQVSPHPNNPRKHPQLQRDAVAASFDELGQIAPIVINVNNGFLVDGEERGWLALAQDSDVELDVVYVDLTEAEHLKALAYFDATGDLAYYDAEQLGALLQEINSDSPSIQQMLAELAVSTHVVPPNDPYAEWVGMPEFEQESINAYHSIKVHFKTAEDLVAFAELIGQSVNEKTTFIYHPKQINENLKLYRAMDES